MRVNSRTPGRWWRRRQGRLDSRLGAGGRTTHKLLGVDNRPAGVDAAWLIAGAWEFDGACAGPAAYGGSFLPGAVARCRLPPSGRRLSRLGPGVPTCDDRSRIAPQNLFRPAKRHEVCITNIPVGVTRSGALCSARVPYGYRRIGRLTACVHAQADARGERLSNPLCFAYSDAATITVRGMGNVVRRAPA